MRGLCFKISCNFNVNGIGGVLKRGWYMENPFAAVGVRMPRFNRGKWWIFEGFLLDFRGDKLNAQDFGGMIIHGRKC